MSNTPFLRLMSNHDKARFWDKVDRRGPDECWPWTAAISKNGYGSFGLNGGRLTSSRVAYGLGWWKDPGDEMVLHKCDNRRCCNPDHLYLGDVKQNARDMMERGRHKTVPQNGERNGNAKLTSAAVEEIRGQIAAGDNNKVIAARFGVTHQMISKIRRGHFWKGDSVSKPYPNAINEKGTDLEKNDSPSLIKELKWSERWDPNPRPLTPQESADG